MDLKNLEDEIKKCSKCRLSETRNNVVPGEGSPTAEIMLIGEGPGKNEDEQGRPFVGAAGKFLDEMLDAIGCKREDVYIANVVKCRPPNNRDPLPDEIEICWTWLEKQIEIIKPKIIVILGRHSLGRFLPGMRISQVHGQPYRKPIPNVGKIIFFPCYHPAAALYNGGLRETLIQDFKKIPKIIEISKEDEQKDTEEKESNKNKEEKKNKQEKLF